MTPLVGHDFVTVAPSDWAVSEIPILFTKESVLHVGGVTSACGFIGKMAEVSSYLLLPHPTHSPSGAVDSCL